MDWDFHEDMLEGTGFAAAVPKEARGALPTLYCVGFGKEQLQRVLGSVYAVPGAPACVWVAFDSPDWNRDFSPWPASALSKKAEPFPGGGERTLAWMTDKLLPRVERDLPVQREARERLVLGYSLAGLFALWACHATSAFGACGCCSASLWYDGFVEFLEKQASPEGLRVYMSLGDREGKARSPRLAAVEARTAQVVSLLQARASVASVHFEPEAGGHFDDADGRLARAALWLLDASASGLSNA